jgi:hypothetical protein
MGKQLLGPTHLTAYLKVNCPPTTTTTTTTTTYDIACGPYFDSYESTLPPPLELNTIYAPVATVSEVGNRMEGANGNPVTVIIKAGSTLRGVDLRAQPRTVTLAVTTSSFFAITSAASVAGAAPLGTDRMPLVEVSSDMRTATFVLGGKRCLVLGHVEYTVRLFVTNPLSFFWAITASEPWTVTVEQGPRVGCQGCPKTRYDGKFAGPAVDFAVREFQALPGSRELNALSSLVLVFQILHPAVQVEAALPLGATARSCDAYSMEHVNFWERRFLKCTPHGSSFLITNQPPGRQPDLIPTGWVLSFRGTMQNTPDASQGFGFFSALAVNSIGDIVGRTKVKENKKVQLYPGRFASLHLTAHDNTPNVTSVVTASFSLSTALQPGDSIRVIAPLGFLWTFR